MKKVILILTCLALAFSFVACDNSDKIDQQTEDTAKNDKDKDNDSGGKGGGTTTEPKQEQPDGGGISPV